MRPAELYALRWSDLDLKSNEVSVTRQYSPKSRKFELPKNGKPRSIVLTGPARGALMEMPRPIDPDTLIFRGGRGGALTGRTQHYYWNPVRCVFGRPSMTLYELRHFCGSWLLNDLELPPQDVAHQLGHTDGGALVMSLYGHPSERLARERIKRATGASFAPVASISEPKRSHEA
jgi:integrase